MRKLYLNSYLPFLSTQTCNFNPFLEIRNFRIIPSPSPHYITLKTTIPNLKETAKLSSSSIPTLQSWGGFSVSLTWPGTIAIELLSLYSTPALWPSLLPPYWSSIWPTSCPFSSLQCLNSTHIIHREKKKKDPWQNVPRYWSIHLPMGLELQHIPGLENCPCMPCIFPSTLVDLHVRPYCLFSPLPVKHSLLHWD